MKNLLKVCQIILYMVFGYCYSIYIHQTFKTDAFTISKPILIGRHVLNSIKFNNRWQNSASCNAQLLYSIYCPNFSGTVGSWLKHPPVTLQFRIQTNIIFYDNIIFEDALFTVNTPSSVNWKLRDWKYLSALWSGQDILVIDNCGLLTALD